MKKVVAVFLVFCLFFLLCAGCKTDQPTLTQDKALELAEQYNVIPTLCDLSFENAIPIHKALEYYKDTSHIGDPPYKSVFEKYRIDNASAVVPNYVEGLTYYAVPKEKVESYLLETFVALDFSENSSQLSADGQHYYFSSIGGGSGLAGAYLQVTNIHVSGTTATFDCQSVSYATNEVFKTQQFVLSYENQRWKYQTIKAISAT